MIKLRLKELCKERGLTLTDLATKVGINKVTIYYYVSGRSFPTKENLMMMANVLNVNISDLFAPSNDFTAMVHFNGVTYHFNDIEALKLRLSEWEKSVEAN